MRKADIGAALDSLTDDVKQHVLDLVAQYRQHADQPFAVTVLKQAVDAPHRAQAQLAAWMARYDARAGAGSAQTYMVSCLAAASASKNLATVNSELVALVGQAQTLVAHVKNDGWTWNQVATAIETQFNPAAAVDFSYARLPVPDNYQTVWGEAW